jgi:hypothetical protein
MPKRIGYAAVAGGVLLGLMEPAAAAAPGGLCAPDEQVFFECVVGARKALKTVALCGSKSLSKTSGYLQYRFGKPGALELRFPENREDGRTLFRYAHYGRFQVERTAVNFRNGGVAYSVFDRYEGETRPAVRERGVAVTPANAAGQTVTLLCTGQGRSELHRLQAILPCDRDDPLNLGECP